MRLEHFQNLLKKTVGKLSELIFQLQIVQHLFLQVIVDALMIPDVRSEISLLVGLVAAALQGAFVFPVAVNFVQMLLQVRIASESRLTFRAFQVLSRLMADLNVTFEHSLVPIFFRAVLKWAFI